MAQAIPFVEDTTLAPAPQPQQQAPTAPSPPPQQPSRQPWSDPAMVMMGPPAPAPMPQQAQQPANAPELSIASLPIVGEGFLDRTGPSRLTFTQRLAQGQFTTEQRRIAYLRALFGADNVGRTKEGALAIRDPSTGRSTLLDPFLVATPEGGAEIGATLREFGSDIADIAADVLEAGVAGVGQSALVEAGRAAGATLGTGAAPGPGTAIGAALGGVAAAGLGAYGARLVRQLGEVSLPGQATQGGFFGPPEGRQLGEAVLANPYGGAYSPEQVLGGAARAGVEGAAGETLGESVSYLARSTGKAAARRLIGAGQDVPLENYNLSLATEFGSLDPTQVTSSPEALRLKGALAQRAGIGDIIFKRRVQQAKTFDAQAQALIDDVGPKTSLEDAVEMAKSYYVEANKKLAAELRATSLGPVGGDWTRIGKDISSVYAKGLGAMYKARAKTAETLYGEVDRLSGGEPTVFVRNILDELAAIQEDYTSTMGQTQAEDFARFLYGGMKQIIDTGRARLIAEAKQRGASEAHIKAIAQAPWWKLRGMRAMAMEVQNTRAGFNQKIREASASHPILQVTTVRDKIAERVRDAIDKDLSESAEIPGAMAESVAALRKANATYAKMSDGIRQNENVLLESVAKLVEDRRSDIAGQLVGGGEKSLELTRDTLKILRGMPGGEELAVQARQKYLEDLFHKAAIGGPRHGEGYVIDPTKVWDLYNENRAKIDALYEGDPKGLLAIRALMQRFKNLSEVHISQMPVGWDKQRETLVNSLDALRSGGQDDKAKAVASALISGVFEGQGYPESSTLSAKGVKFSPAKFAQNFYKNEGMIRLAYKGKEAEFAKLQRFVKYAGRLQDTAGVGPGGSQTAPMQDIYGILKLLSSASLGFITADLKGAFRSLAEASLQQVFPRQLASWIADPKAAEHMYRQITARPTSLTVGSALRFGELIAPAVKEEITAPFSDTWESATGESRDQER